MSEGTPGKTFGEKLTETGFLRALEAAEAKGRAEGMAAAKSAVEQVESDTTAQAKPHKRFNDHWQFKALQWAMLGFLALAATGGTWVVSRAVANESKNVEQDQRIQKGEERWAEYREEQKMQRQILEDIRREVKK